MTSHDFVKLSNRMENGSFIYDFRIANPLVLFNWAKHLHLILRQLATTYALKLYMLLCAAFALLMYSSSVSRK
jgi:hypothetical protein